MTDYLDLMAHFDWKHCYFVVILVASTFFLAYLYDALHEERHDNCLENLTRFPFFDDGQHSLQHSWLPSQALINLVVHF